MLHLRDEEIEEIKRIMTGRGSFKAQVSFFMGVLVFFGFVSAIAIALFPTRYRILNNHVSNMGGMVANPVGHIYWNIGIFLVGLALIPYMLYLNRYLSPVSPTLARFTNGIKLLACVGFSFVGIFPEDIPIAHQIPAVVALIGLGVAFYLDWLIIRKYCRNNGINWPKTFWFHALYTQFNFFFVMAMIITKINQPVSLAWIDPRVFHFPLWEWLYLTSIFVWLLGILFVMRDIGMKPGDELTLN